MLMLDTETGRFMLRAAAIIRREGRVLAQRASGDVSWALPGGRVEMGEAAAETVAREIREELQVTATVGSLRYVVENFYSRDGRIIHGLGLYFDTEIGPDISYHPENVVHRCRDGGLDIEFRWLDPRDAGCDLRPAALLGLLMQDQPGAVHIVNRDATT